MTTRVLVVDDDERIRAMLTSTLTFAGFTVESVSSAAEAFTRIPGGRFDVVLLDVMMPGTDGFEAVQLIRRHDGNLPVIFLSARDSVDDRVRGLRLGADDYITKPFSSAEVIARIEARTRRSDRSATLRCADLELDADRHFVRRGGQDLELSPTEFRLLRLLLENKGRVLSKRQIIDRIWQYDFGGDTNIVERFISNLRRKIDDDRPAIIRTVRGFGYSIDDPE
ncbi:response regulator transcription factor [Actinoplanes sp. NBRC 101535]|uniref:response regulator transcription factor n=1 Tax=Actinoplanes sp. NBRC 101535 TaxID=3032196 RepID=UPI0024A4B12F|nr:response regulator transcription factor [Actinoplanes sp. NBRC 101535]GLY05750.1 DNA-binding response regulator [Actinoplanes sp. NBRC 101535]